MAIPLHIAVFTKNRTNAAYQAARLGAERTAARLGAYVTHFVPDTPDDVEQQRALIDAALTQRPDAFVFVPVHETAVNDGVAKINAAGIPLSNFINRLTSGNCITFVGSDDTALALGVARRLLDHLGGRGNIAIMEGTAGSVTSQSRLAGFRQAMRQFPGAQVLAVRAADYQREPARQVMEQWLEKFPCVDGILCANDVMALGAIEAMRAVGRMIPLVGVNALPEAITALKQGALLATVDFDAMKMACVATEAAIRHLRGQPVPRQISLPVQIVDRANCAPWDRPLEMRVCPRWEDVVR
jgi:ribose transport system substrate-binding protein